MASVGTDPRVALVLEEPPTRLADLRPGLLVFFARPSVLQTWAEWFGHEWRHIGITVQTDEGLRVASYCIRKCFRLDDPFEIMPAYSRVGIAQIFTEEDELRAFERFCRSFQYLDRSDSPYTTSAIFVGPLHLFARKCKPGLARKALFWLIERYCRGQQLRYRDRSAFACSTFAWAAVHASRRRPLRIPLSAHPEDEAAYATPSNETDELMARWLCGPSEIWDAISPESRSELDLTDHCTKPTPLSIVTSGLNEEVATSRSQTPLRRRSAFSVLGTAACLVLPRN